jgi:hypothetical protein
MTVMAHLGLVGAVTVNVTLQVGCVNKARQIGSLGALGLAHSLPGLSGSVSETLLVVSDNYSTWKVTAATLW